MNIRTIRLPKYKYMVLALLGVALVSLVLYIYGVNQTVRNVVKRQAIESELTRLTAEIGEKEFAYLSAKSRIDLDRATELGFRVVETDTFVARRTSVALAEHSSHE